jgi:hypothetical protein
MPHPAAHRRRRRGAAGQCHVQAAIDEQQGKAADDCPISHRLTDHVEVAFSGIYGVLYSAVIRNCTQSVLVPMVAGFAWTDSRFYAYT